MTSAQLAALAAKLLVAAHTLSGYPMPDFVPQVELRPHAWLEARACTGPCPVYGWYPRAGVVYLDDSLDLDHDLFARSVLVHELVHVLQAQTGRARAPLSCAVWDAREREAYKIQYQWLARQDAPSDAYLRLGMPPRTGLCAE